ncbi:MAG: VWA domain-containing protein [Acidobacteria bacterium]|nr:VWA domain-containing protein [Acidobacteriota bacterium]
MTRRQLALTCLAAALSAAFPVAGSAQPRDRTLFVLALDKDGAPVPDLGVTDFIVREDGNTREVLRVSRAVVPMDVTLLVDNSRAAEQDIPFLRTGLESFVDAMTPAHQVALVTFGERPDVRSDYTTSPTQLKNAIGRLFAIPESGAYLMEALIDVSRGLQTRESERAVVVVIHTEGPEFSNSHYNTVIDAVKRAGARLIVLTIANPRGDLQTDEARSRAVVIDRGSRGTGGYRDILISNQALPDKLRKLANQLLNQYQVVYGRPDTLIPPEKIEVSVKKPEIVALGIPARTPAKKP